MHSSHLSRRAFNQLLLAAAAAPSLPRSRNDVLANTFENPPASAGPHTYWMWMNGNVTREGLTLDLEAMRRNGIVGVYLYNCAVGIPRGRIEYGSGEWLDLVHHAVAEAARLGIAVAIHNAPGYSGTGGPWITPERSMQELVWTETMASAEGGGSASIDVRLPRPRARLGFYRDAAVLAYPSLKAETVLMRDVIESAQVNGRSFDPSILTDGDRTHRVRLERQADGKVGSLEIRLSKTFTARAVSIYRSPEDPIDPFDGPRDYPPRLTLQSSPDGVVYRDIGTIDMPALRSMNSPGVQSFAAAEGRFFRLLSSSPTWITGVELHAGPRLAAWSGKANGAAPPSVWPNNPAVSEDLCIDPNSVIDLSGHMDAEGRLRWSAPQGRWTIVRLGHTTTAETVAAAPDSGLGLECDKLSKEGVDLHFTGSLLPLFDRLGPLVGTALSAVSIDSWEAGRGNWTPLFPEYFRTARGYDLHPYLLAMTGRVVGSAERSDRFLFDVRRTHAQMLVEHYYGYFQARLHALGLKLHAEPYGDGTFESLDVAEQLDVTMGEFWVRYTYGSKSYIDLVTGATHTLGQRIAACEAFTGAPLTSRWTGHPYALKAEGDRMFASGVNRFVFHTFVHQPHPTAQPGMTMGPFGTHFDRNNTWMQTGSAGMTSSTGYVNYLRRAQFLLQSGEPVADLCFLKPEEPSSGVPDARSGPLAVPAGYAVDVVSAGAVLRRSSVKDGRVVFSNTMGYRCMILSPMLSMTVPLLRRIAELVEQGMTLIASAVPASTPSLEAFPEAEIAQLHARLWPTQGSGGDAIRVVGKGSVVLTSDVRKVLQRAGLGPDFTCVADTPDADILFHHRRIDGDDVFFVSNQRRRAERVTGSFRVENGVPELWNAETGTRTGASSYRSVGPRTELSLDFEPAGSIFVVFRGARAHGAMVQSEVDSHRAADATHRPSRPVVSGDFTLTVWAQPETYCLPRTGFLVAAQQVDGGRATMGLAAGQNGVFLYERGSGPARLVLKREIALCGWTHLAVSYRANRPTLYINGKEEATGVPSALQVLAFVEPAVPLEKPPRYFEGNSAAPVVREPLGADQILREAQAGVPAPVLPQGRTVARTLAGRLAPTVWGSPQKLTRPWTVQLASQVITMDDLIPLNQHHDFDVRHFSGTAVYRTTFHAAPLKRGEMLHLDLGYVDVAAHVLVNGHPAGTAWKPPYRLEMTEWVRPGENRIEIYVTTLWPNRLIGDEQLPPENDYDVHGPIRQLPSWFTAGAAKPGKRATFAVWHHYQADAPLLQSGLSGPVRLLPSHVV